MALLGAGATGTGSACRPRSNSRDWCEAAETAAEQPQLLLFLSIDVSQTKTDPFRWAHNQAGYRCLRGGHSVTMARHFWLCDSPFAVFYVTCGGDNFALTGKLDVYRCRARRLSIIRGLPILTRSPVIAGRHRMAAHQRPQRLAVAQTLHHARPTLGTSR
jgi:hypothetical protein